MKLSKAEAQVREEKKMHGMGDKIIYLENEMGVREASLLKFDDLYNIDHFPEMGADEVQAPGHSRSEHSCYHERNIRGGLTRLQSGDDLRPIGVSSGSGEESRRS